MPRIVNVFVLTAFRLIMLDRFFIFALEFLSNAHGL